MEALLDRVASALDEHSIPDHCLQSDVSPKGPASMWQGVDAQVFVSRINVTLNTKSCEECSDTKGCQVDSDGDLDPPRNPARSNVTDGAGFAVTIVHANATPLKSVGLQIWSGALVLSDFLCHRRQAWEGSVVVELGAGVGLPSLVMAHLGGAEHVFVTDCPNEGILALCQRNLELNPIAQATTPIHVRSWDWSQPRPVVKSTGEGGPFEWTERDTALLERASVFLAADVLYDDVATDAFLDLIMEVLRPGKVLYLSLERRVCFTIADMEPAAPAIERFFSSLEDCKLEATSVPLHFPCCIHYSRTPQLELWEIRCTRGKG